jgi:hypothetical protein
MSRRQGRCVYWSIVVHNGLVTALMRRTRITIARVFFCYTLPVEGHEGEIGAGCFSIVVVHVLATPHTPQTPHLLYKTLRNFPGVSVPSAVWRGVVLCLLPPSFAV